MNKQTTQKIVISSICLLVIISAIVYVYKPTTTPILATSEIGVKSSPTHSLSLAGDYCEDPLYPYYCGDVCGPTQGWCDNYNDNPAGCNADRTRCCLASDKVYCNDQICLNSQADCDSLRDNPQQGTCRTGRVQDYSLHVCCPSGVPFASTTLSGPDAGDVDCYSVPGADTDNWYTQQSDCKGFERINGGIQYFVNGTVKSNGMAPYSTGLREISVDNPMKYMYCSGTDLIACKDDISQTSTNPYHTGEIVNTGIFHYVNAGKIVGKCGIQCLQATDCPAGNPIGEVYCSGTNLVQKVGVISCKQYKCVQTSSTEQIIKQCSNKGCGSFSDGARCNECTGNEIENYDCGPDFLKTWPKKQCNNGVWQDLATSNPCACVSDLDCKQDYGLETAYCGDEKTVTQKIKDYSCTDGKCVSNEVVKNTQTCDYKCTDGKCEINTVAYGLIVAAGLIGIGVGYYIYRRMKK